MSIRCSANFGYRAASTGWDLAHWRLWPEDQARNALLAQRLKKARIYRRCKCGTYLPLKGTSPDCKKCRNRRLMRAKRKR